MYRTVIHDNSKLFFIPLSSVQPNILSPQQSNVSVSNLFILNWNFRPANELTNVYFAVADVAVKF